MELPRAPLAWCPLLGEGQKPLCLPCPPWSRSQPPAAGSGEPRCKDHSRGEKSPSPTMGAPSKPQAVPSVFPPCPGLHPAGSLVPSPAAPGDGTRDSGSKGRESHASRRSWQPCVHTPGHTQVPGPAHATHTPATEPQDPAVPRASLRKWHQSCHSSRSWSLLAIPATLPWTQPLYSQNPEGKWPGRAGSSGGRRWKCWPKPRFDLSPISRARSPPSLRGQLGSVLSSTLEQPWVCGNPPRLSRTR